MMFNFSMDFAHDGNLEPGVVGTAESESLRRVTVATGKHEGAKQMSFRVDDAPRDPGISDELLCRTAIEQALRSPGGFYGAQRLEQPEAQLSFEIPPWEGRLEPVR